MMRICHIIKATGIAGAEGHLLVLLPALAAQNCQIEALILAEPNHPMTELTQRLTTAGVTAHSLPIHTDLDLGLVGQIRRQLNRFQPQVLHTHLIHADLHGLLANRGSRRVQVSSRHNDDGFRRRALLKPLLRLINAPITHMVAISNALRQFTIQVEGVAPQRITTIHYGLPAQPPADPHSLRRELNLAPDALLVVTVARHTHQKGLDTLLTAWPQVQTQHPNAHLALVGAGPLTETLKAQAANLPQVHFLGWRTDSLACMAAADVFVLPSRWEGFGLVLLEAMSQARPIVASAVSAIPEIVLPDQTGLLVPPADPTALATALNHLLANLELRHRLGQAGQQRLLSHFQPENMTQHHLNLYHQLISQGENP